MHSAGHIGNHSGVLNTFKSVNESRAANDAPPGFMYKIMRFLQLQRPLRQQSHWFSFRCPHRQRTGKTL